MARPAQFGTVSAGVATCGRQGVSDRLPVRGQVCPSQIFDTHPGEVGRVPRIQGAGQRGREAGVGDAARRLVVTRVHVGPARRGRDALRRHAPEDERQLRRRQPVPEERNELVQLGAVGRSADGGIALALMPENPLELHRIAGRLRRREAAQRLLDGQCRQVVARGRSRTDGPGQCPRRAGESGVAVRRRDDEDPDVGGLGLQVFPGHRCGGGKTAGGVVHVQRDRGGPEGAGLSSELEEARVFNVCRAIDGKSSPGHVRLPDREKHVQSGDGRCRLRRHDARRHQGEDRKANQDAVEPPGRGPRRGPAARVPRLP